MLNYPGQTGCIQRAIKGLGRAWDGKCALLIAYCFCQNDEWRGITHASFQTADNDPESWNANSFTAKPWTWKPVASEEGNIRNPNTLKGWQNSCLPSNFAAQLWCLPWSVQHSLGARSCASQVLRFSPSGRVRALTSVWPIGLMLHLCHLVCHLCILKKLEGISNWSVIGLLGGGREKEKV